MRSVVIFGRGDQAGWSPVAHFASIASHCLDAELLTEGVPAVQGLRRFLLMAGRRRPKHGAGICFVIGAVAHELAHVLEAKSWLGGYRKVIGLVTDSYWTDDIPVEIRRDRMFDHIFITSAEDLPAWRRKVGDRVSWLPWGSDALDGGSDRSEREWDVLRVGRQPPEWEDDVQTASAAKLLGLAFRPRPAGSLDWRVNQALIMAAYASARFTLAFSNLAHRSEHTHTSREYLTGRWTDALASGAVVAGVPPRTPSIDQLLWDGATLDLGSTSLQDGLCALRVACRTWTPRQAHNNHLRALERLDWRWRVAEVARVAELECPVLDAELERLKQRILQLGQQTAHPA